MFATEKEIHIGDKLAYRGSLSASLSQELIVAYRWPAYRVAYRVIASRRCGQRLGGGRRLASRRRLGGGGGSATAAPRSRLRLEGRWRGGRRRPAWRATARRAWQRRRFGAGSAAGGLAAGGSAAAAAWQRRRLGVSSAFTCRLAYRSAYPGAYLYLSGLTYRICVDNHSCTKNARDASASGSVATIIFSYYMFLYILCIVLELSLIHI